MNIHPSFSATGWTFDLVLHGGRVEVQGHRLGETISCWMTPTESPCEVVQHLLQSPSCCLHSP